jgi:spore germination protein KC
MMKKCLVLLCLFFLVFFLSGCWNYRGLNEMTVITGIAIDEGQDRKGYHLTFETVDLSVPVKELGLKSKVIEADGETVFEAVRNAKKRTSNKLYFGQTQILIVSEDIAKNEGMKVVIDCALRDGECRETLCFLVSQEETAQDILTAEGVNQSVISNEIKEIVKSDQEVSASTIYIELYEIFDTLNSPGNELILPAIHVVENSGSSSAEVNGITVFKDNKFVGYLTAEESKYYLFIVNQIKGGIWALSSGDTDKATLEISKNKTKTSFQYKDGKVKMKIKTDTDVFLGEYMGEMDSLDEKQLAALEKAAEKDMESNILNVIKKVQTNYGADIFGFGNLIYKKDFDLWEGIKDDWDTYFQELEVEVKASVHIVNTAAIKEG